VILYQQLAQRLSKWVKVSEKDVYRLINELIATAVTIHDLLTRTMGQEAYSDACRIVNAVILDYRMDEMGLLPHNSWDEQKRKPELEELINRLESSESKKRRLFETLWKFGNAMNRMLVISENDESASAGWRDECTREINELKTLQLQTDHHQPGSIR